MPAKGGCIHDRYIYIYILVTERSLAVANCGTGLQLYRDGNLGEVRRAVRPRGCCDEGEAVAIQRRLHPCVRGELMECPQGVRLGSWAGKESVGGRRVGGGGGREWGGVGGRVGGGGQEGLARGVGRGRRGMGRGRGVEE